MGIGNLIESMALSDGTIPARSFFAITPSNTVPLAQPTRGLIVGTSGDIKVTGVDGVDCVITGVTAGDHPYAVTKVYATGTTAAGITGMA